MKKFLSFAFAILAVFFVASCSDSDDNSSKNYDMTVQVSYPEGIDAESITDLKIVVTNTATGETQEFTSLDQIKSLKQGSYTVNVTGKIKDDATAIVTGVGKVDLYANASCVVKLDVSYKSSIIFKTIYTTGSVQYYMKEGYFELVNNSDEVQYLDGLILSAPMGNQTVENAWQANNMADLYNNGQGAILQFPGTGKDYPLQPGQSVLIANNAINHKLAYGDDQDQAEAYSKAPDLSKADWEIYLDYNANDADYDAPNLKVLFTNNRYMFAWGLGVTGRSFILVKLPEGTDAEKYVADNEMYEPGSSSTYLSYVCFPSKYVLDAVDTYNPATEEHVCTFLPKDDATGVKASPSWEAKCVRRKVTKIENGRAYYKDTNSSADDFLSNQPLTPGETPTAVDPE